MKPIAQITLGILCIIVGFAGLFLPLIPGIVLIAVGIGLLSDWYYGDETKK